MPGDFALTKAVAALKVPLRDVKAQLTRINEPHIRGDLETAVSMSERLIEKHELGSLSSIADDMADLRSLWRAADLGDDIQDRTGDDRLRVMRGLVGNVVLDCESVIRLAAGLNILVSEPQHPMPIAAPVSKAGIEDTLALLSSRIEDLETLLRDKLSPTKDQQDATVAQTQIVRPYVDEMNIRIEMFKAALQTGRQIDLTFISRVVDNIARVTVEFASTVASAASRATLSLREALRSVVQSVNRFSGDILRLVKQQSQFDDTVVVETWSGRVWNHTPDTRELVKAHYNFQYAGLRLSLMEYAILSSVAKGIAIANIARDLSMSVADVEEAGNIAASRMGQADLLHAAQEFTRFEVQFDRYKRKEITFEEFRVITRRL